jgi:hypothetical protein
MGYLLPAMTTPATPLRPEGSTEFESTVREYSFARATASELILLGYAPDRRLV